MECWNLFFWSSTPSSLSRNLPVMWRNLRLICTAPVKFHLARAWTDIEHWEYLFSTNFVDAVLCARVLVSTLCSPECNFLVSHTIKSYRSILPWGKHYLSTLRLCWFTCSAAVSCWVPCFQIHVPLLLYRMMVRWQVRHAPWWAHLDACRFCSDQSFCCKYVKPL